MIVKNLRYTFLKKFPYFSGLGYASLYCRFIRIRHFRYFSILLTYILILCTSGMSKKLFSKQLSNLLDKKYPASQFLQEIFVQIHIDTCDQGATFFSGKSERVVVDIGAASPTHFSNSKYLLENGFFGVLVEPNPYFYNQLREYYGEKNKIWNGAIVGESSSKKQTMIDAGYLSSLSSSLHHDQFEKIRKRIQKSHFNVQVLGSKSFVTKFNIPQKFLYLSIDAEGLDLNIIQHWPFQVARPICVTVEHNFNPFIEKSIDECMKNNGYSRVLRRFSSVDGYYVENEMIL